MWNGSDREQDMSGVKEQVILKGFNGLGWVVQEKKWVGFKYSDCEVSDGTQ